MMQLLRTSPVIVAVALAMAFAPSPGAAQTSCRLCAQDESPVSGASPFVASETPLSIAISTRLDFSRLALRNQGGGSVDLDAGSGMRMVSGGLTSLGGPALRGRAEVTGEPGRLIRVDLPSDITLSSPTGDTVELTRLETDLPAQPRLDMSGRLSFAFGGRLKVNGNANGNFRGRVRITAEYE